MNERIEQTNRAAAGLTSFVEWGGPTWADQVQRGLDWLGDVDGLRVLEIGTRYGGMATLLARRGARVTALDITSETFEVARETSERHGVGTRISYEVYSGEATRPSDGV
jgi:2-polyprenyl-3-methyl-5-hydroxy-6-metoxy-1,4-benzoquinol methylase